MGLASFTHENDKLVPCDSGDASVFAGPLVSWGDEYPAIDQLFGVKVWCQGCDQYIYIYIPICFEGPSQIFMK